MPLLSRSLPFALVLLPGLALAQGAPLSLTPQPGGTAPKTGAPQAATPAPVETAQQSVQRINAYLNKLVSFTSRFVQIGADGRRFEGSLYVQRPGRLRFEYDPPSPLEIVADGTSVVIRDRKLATQDLYAIGQTPLKFLLANHIDITKDAKLLRISREPRDGTITAVLEDKTTFGGTSRIRLTFDDAEIALKRWVITDPQGFDTQVTLSDIDTTKKLPAKLFTIDYSRAPESNR